ncbi:hypothetical protein EG328_010419 [Venturia inaequalis]|uniref:Protein NO VEIN C-terminal domain-containing protein n=1 Tax=Venturia inaequalis TaxID=5025 RepID=A0A8H3U6I4_VENIN|nr:hypothetical protein EG328_010419 [Venturia inaequalis]KAE9971475.1 hypothetical protein EG327_009850 [Venturia inaequalis]
MTLVAKTDVAQEYIDQLREELGGLTRKDREEFSQSALNMVSNLRQKLGASTKVLAAELYAKDTRFVYELIQNAEDNHYSIAEASVEPPSLKFGLYEDRIEIDSNEDGFTKDDIKAICSVGESTKAGATGHIGEKGIGFKSVFKVASKVHVQAGPFSFAFEYDRDGNDNGLGMITPMNVEPYKLPAGVRTRIILYLAPYCKRSELVQEFQSLPEALLLFLKKLEYLSVKISLPTSPSVDISCSRTRSGSRVDIHKTTLEGSSTSKYWVTKRTVMDMPEDQARKEVKEDKESVYIKQADVVLAFPLDDQDIPVIEQQHVFAFLPLRRAGYKFLIQSDFITQASREDIFDSAWNNRLLDEVTEAFIDSVNTFSKHPTLQYHWLRYVPTDDLADDVWGRLQLKLSKRLASWEIFQASGGSGFRKANALREVPHEYRDVNQDTLLPDLPKEPTAYVSDSYDKAKDIPILRYLGLIDLTAAEFLARLEHDLRRNPCDSVMRSSSQDPQWHKNIAQMLLKLSKVPSYLQSIKMLPIIPIKVPTEEEPFWVVPRGAVLFFPTTGGIAVPPGLPFKLVDPHSLVDPDRVSFFRALGVQECDPKHVLSSIEHRFATGGCTLSQGVAYVKFMFWHHTAIPSSPRPKVKLASDQLEWFDPHDSVSGWTYCTRYEGQYTMIAVQGPSLLRSPDNKKTTRFKFPHDLYYETLKKCERREDKTGIEWFREFFDLQSTPQLHRRGYKQAASYELKHIAAHRSEILLGILEAKWSQYKPIADLDNIIKSCEVPISGYDAWRELNETFLPLPKLTSIVSRLKLEKGFGFLKELEGLEASAESKWTFLNHFGVGSDADVYFWLALLAFETYLIWDPRLKNGHRWVSRQICLWHAPDWLSYSDVLCLGRLPEYRGLEGLFRSTLSIPDANHENFIDYLAFIKAGDVPSEEEATRIPKIYHELGKKDIEKETKKYIGSQFEEQNLVYYPHDQSWHCPSACVWAEDNIQLPGKVSIATAYKGRKTFFTKVLGVVEPTLELHISALKDKIANSSSKEEVVLEMRNICAYSPEPEALTDLRDCKCFPVIYANGDTAWSTCSETFSIVDRRDYGELFAGQLTLLDLPLEKTHSLRCLLYGLDLADRYVSTKVQEQTQKPDGDLHDRLTAGLRNKAYAIVRYAAHLGLDHSSNGPLAMFETLQSMDVYVSESIPSLLSIEQDDNIFTSQQDTGYLHIEESDGKLRVYVLKDKKRRRVCLVRHLAIALLKHFGVPNLADGTFLGSILVAGSIFEVDELLKCAGIIEVQGIERPDVKEVSDDESCASDDDHASSHATNSGEIVGRPDLYKRLLEALTAQAEDLVLEGLPLKNCFAVARIPTSQGLSTCLALGSNFNDERNFKVGAAGELFMYHFLSNLGLPNFDQTCWQSSIRHRAALHQDYQWISHWPGKETADIIYTDHQQVLTKMLVQKNYLDPEWATLYPTYYIEVKSTTGSCDTRFFCSQEQVDLMKDMHHKKGELVSMSKSKRIYLVARVFALGDSGTGLYLYVNPEPPKPLGELEFQANDEKYIVTPVGQE